MAYFLIFILLYFADKITNVMFYSYLRNPFCLYHYEISPRLHGRKYLKTFMED